MRLLPRAVSVLVIAMVAGSGAAAAERFRTPAEIELRRQEIARRLQAIDEDDRRLAASLVDSDALQPRQEQLRQEAAALREEAARLALIRTRGATGPLHARDPQGLGAADLTRQGTQGGPGTPATAYNPAIAIIPDMNYYTDNRRGAGARLTRQADGFDTPDGAEPAPTDPERGFNLRELEAVFAGAIDPYFDVWATVILQGTHIQAEEAYAQTRKFVPGLQLRVGRFLSGIGYINRQHPHQWDFVDQALPYEAMLGGGLADAGVQVTWLPALPIYTLVGFEALQGNNSRLANRLVEEVPEIFQEKAGPRVVTGFFRVSPDIGYSGALQVGVSYVHSRGHQEASERENTVVDAFEGNAWLGGIDAVWRFESGRAYGRGNATVQSEYLYRKTDLQQIGSAGQPLLQGPSRIAAQDGFYVQGTYGFIERWTVGGRIDAVGLKNRLETRAGRQEAGATVRTTVNTTYNPTEFSRIRIQYSHARVRSGGATIPLHQASVQVQLSLGAHGAHRF